MATKSPIRQAVERGAKALTIFYGDESWMKKIRQDNLDLGNPMWCVLGQLNGQSYGAGIKLLGPGVQAAPIEFGFEASSQGRSHSAYARLTRVWKNYLKSKLGR